LNDKLLELGSVEHVVPLDVIVRIDELRQLKRGWLDEKGEAFDAQQLDWVVEAFKNFYPDQAKLPYLFPTPEGNLLAEWSLEANSVSLEIDLSDRTAEWHALNLITNGEETERIDLNESDSWRSLGDTVKKLGGVSE